MCKVKWVKNWMGKFNFLCVCPALWPMNYTFGRSLSCHADLPRIMSWFNQHVSIYTSCGGFSMVYVRQYKAFLGISRRGGTISENKMTEHILQDENWYCCLKCVWSWEKLTLIYLTSLLFFLQNIFLLAKIGGKKQDCSGLFVRGNKTSWTKLRVLRKMINFLTVQCSQQNSGSLPELCNAIVTG